MHFLLLESCSLSRQRLALLLSLLTFLGSLLTHPVAVPPNSRPALQFSSWHLGKIFYVLGRISCGSSFPAL